MLKGVLSLLSERIFPFLFLSREVLCVEDQVFVRPCLLYGCIFLVFSLFLFQTGGVCDDLISCFWDGFGVISLVFFSFSCFSFLYTTKLFCKSLDYMYLIRNQKHGLDRIPTQVLCNVLNFWLAIYI
jgi:hypothetical protein